MDIEAVSQDGTRYPSWEALVAAEANGYVIVGLSARPGSAPIVVGPFLDRDEAKRAQARLRYRWKREEKPYKIRSLMRVLWKEDYS